MPVMDGFQFHQERCKDPELSSIPIILISANNNVEQAQAIGVFASVDKPVRRTQLFRP
jgi:CheY-like chemotaxis protein